MQKQLTAFMLVAIFPATSSPISSFLRNTSAHHATRNLYLKGFVFLHVTVRIASGVLRNQRASCRTDNTPRKKPETDAQVKSERNLPVNDRLKSYLESFVPLIDEELFGFLPQAEPFPVFVRTDAGLPDSRGKTVSVRSRAAGM